jgi:DNA-dependent RNA polymerase auxiliary subunit epsilon
MKTNQHNKRITLVITLHAICDCIESYSSDCNFKDLTSLATDIRKEANRYGENFSNLSEYMLEELNDLNYNKRQLLPALCFVLYREASKLEASFLQENSHSVYLQIETAKKIRDYFKGEFLSKEMIRKISEIFLEIRDKCFQC